MKRFTRNLPCTIALVIVLSLLSVVAGAAQAAGAATPSQAVAALVGPLAGQTGQAGCNALTGQLTDCPITARLRTRLANPIPGVETGNLVSRSQSPPQALDVAEVKLAEDTTEAQVNTRWATGLAAPQSAYVITFVVHKAAGGWLVDDSYCLNDAASSIYNTPTGPCALSDGSGVPGMPQTGAGPAPTPILGLLAGLVAAALGLLQTRRSRHPGRYLPLLPRPQDRRTEEGSHDRRIG